jgi:hypothetical protein
MRRSALPAFPCRGDALRLLALGRIPRCERCERYRALASAHAAPHEPRLTLPAAPGFCVYQVCAPLAARYDGAVPRSEGVDALSIGQAS